MATTLPNMGLVKWDAGIDNFNHTQLAQNFTYIDNHDHTTGKGLQIGSGGVANLSIGTAQIADSAITDGKVSALTPITDAKLASPNNATYKSVFRARGYATNANTGTGSFFLGSPLVPAVTASTMAVEIFYLAIADYAVSNKLPKLQVAIVAFTNNTAPGVSFTAGLNLVSVDVAHATSGNMAYAAGSQIANSTAQVVLPAQNTVSVQASTDFAFPADGFYAIAINMTGTPGVGSFTVLNTQLRIRYV